MCRNAGGFFFMDIHCCGFSFIEMGALPVKTTPSFKNIINN